MKKDFGAFSDFLRDEADDMDAKGRPDEAIDQVTSGHAAGSANRFPARGRGQFIPQTRGRGSTYPLRGGGYRPPSQQSATPAGQGSGRGMPTPAWMSDSQGPSCSESSSFQQEGSTKGRIFRRSTCQHGIRGEMGQLPQESCTSMDLNTF